MAHSPAVLGFYLSGSEALGRSSLTPQVREQIALAVAQTSNCDYCLAAHSAIGKGAGLTDDQMLGARKGTGTDPKATAAVVLARKLVQARGDLSDADIANSRKAGLNDGELAEVVAVACLNLFTNYFNHLNGTEVDFPPAPKM
jgi:AhpD family alkylhydroperoxidase